MKYKDIYIEAKRIEINSNRRNCNRLKQTRKQSSSIV